ncbi:hypothetical protein SprV_0100475600 [Sparganum proliferum]
MISEEEMKHILEAQQASFMALLTEMQRNWGPASRENKRKQMEQRITEFVYDPEGGVNFEAWFRKYEGLFEEEGAELDDKTKVEIMLPKLAQREHERFVQESIVEVVAATEPATVIRHAGQSSTGGAKLEVTTQGFVRRRQIDKSIDRVLIRGPGFNQFSACFVSGVGDYFGGCEVKLVTHFIREDCVEQAVEMLQHVLYDDERVVYVTAPKHRRRQ